MAVLVQGNGAITAVTFVLPLEDPNRFAKSRAVGPAPAGRRYQLKLGFCL